MAELSSNTAQIKWNTMKLNKTPIETETWLNLVKTLPTSNQTPSSLGKTQQNPVKLGKTQ